MGLSGGVSRRHCPRCVSLAKNASSFSLYKSSGRVKGVRGGVGGSGTLYSQASQAQRNREAAPDITLSMLVDISCNKNETSIVEKEWRNKNTMLIGSWTHCTETYTAAGGFSFFCTEYTEKIAIFLCFIIQTWMQWKKEQLLFVLFVKLNVFGYFSVLCGELINVT